jgi:iron transport multicopper oxidase
MYDRPVIGINGEWPIPAINITKGERVIVNMNNQVSRVQTSLCTTPMA